MRTNTVPCRHVKGVESGEEKPKRGSKESTACGSRGVGNVGAEAGFGNKGSQHLLPSLQCGGEGGR